MQCCVLQEITIYMRICCPVIRLVLPKYISTLRYSLCVLPLQFEVIDSKGILASYFMMYMYQRVLVPMDVQ